MPKIKTRRGAAKRFRMTCTGKIMRRHAGMRHILEWKSKGRKRSLRKAAQVSPSDTRRVRLMLA